MPLSKAEIQRRWRERHPELNKVKNRLYHKTYREKVKQKMVKGTRYCRICQNIEAREKFENIFDRGHNIALEIYSLSSVIIFETSDQHPALICKSCRGQLSQAVKFRKQILQSEKLFKRKYSRSACDLKYLRALFEKSADDAAIEIKEEPVEDEEEECENIIIEESEIRPTEILLLPVPEITPSVEAIELKPQERVKFSSEGDGNQIVRILAKFQYACDFKGCHQSFNEEYKLNIHKKIHSPETLQCPLCQRVFNNEQKFTQHVDYHKAKARMAFTCDRCGRKFPYVSALRKHMKVVHLPPDKQFVCHVCAKAFRDQGPLNSHVKIHDESAKIFQCEKCPSRFISGYKLKRHMSTHGDKKLFECSECQESFVKKSIMLDHKKKVHGIDDKDNNVQFRCTQCNQSFDSHRLLRMHTALEHEKNELNIPKGKLNHKCKFCPKRFNYFHLLKLHMKSFHYDQMPFDCFVCKGKFPDKKEFDDHMKRKHGIEILEDTLDTQQEAIEVDDDQIEFLDELL